MFLKIIVAFLFVFAFIMFPIFRCAVAHPLATAYNGAIDLYAYFKYKKYNDAEPTVGEISCFSGLFGHGKTLSEVHKVVSLYNRYNGKLVFKDGSFKTQRVIVLSNVKLFGVEYYLFSNFTQLVQLADSIVEYDKNNGTYTVIYVVMDEMQNVANSRNFKTNFKSTSDVLRVLTQIRKYHCSIFYTSTRFVQTDAFVRQDTSFVYECHKVWRFQVIKKYDAWDMENCTNSTMIRPVSVSCWFVRNKDYSAYDTHALANQIKDDVVNGEMIPQSERIIEFTPSGEPIHPSRKFKKVSSK